MQENQYTLIYDTYCGWCYGAAPLFQQLIEADVTVTALHRNLFQGGPQLKMSNGFGAQAEQIDRRIEQLTGQPFSQTYIDQILRSDSEELNSGLTARAAALIQPQGFADELSLAHRLQQARYVEGRSASDPEPVLSALQSLLRVSMSREQIEHALWTDATTSRMESTSQQAAAIQREAGVNGVPTLLRTRQGQTEVIPLQSFYQSPASIRALLS